MAIIYASASSLFINSSKSLYELKSFVISDEDWFKNVEQYSSKCMYYDEQNLKFLNEMKFLNVPIKDKK